MREVVDRLDILIVEVRALREAIERRGSDVGHPPPDTASAPLVRAIREAVADRVFTVGELLEHARLVPPLAAAIVAVVGALNGKKLGKALRRLEGVAFDEVMIARVGVERDGVVWKAAAVFAAPKAAKPLRIA